MYVYIYTHKSYSIYTHNTIYIYIYIHSTMLDWGLTCWFPKSNFSCYDMTIAPWLQSLSATGNIEKLQKWRFQFILKLCRVLDNTRIWLASAVAHLGPSSPLLRMQDTAAGFVFPSSRLFSMACFATVIVVIPQDLLQLGPLNQWTARKTAVACTSSHTHTFDTIR